MKRTQSVTHAPPKLEPLGPAQLEVLAALHARCFETGWDQAALETLLAAPGGFGTLATDRAGNTPVGFVMARVIAGECEILTIGVIPGARKQGVGMHLLDSVLTDAWSRGAQTVMLEVADDNTAGLALYGAAGFSVVGRRPGYYRRSGGAVDAHIMEKLRPAVPGVSDNRNN